MAEAARALEVREPVRELVDEASGDPLGPWDAPRPLAAGEVIEAWLAPPGAKAWHVWSVARVEGARAYLARAIGPQPGPQQQFVDTEADLAFYGGGAGGGKSWGLLYDQGRWTHLGRFRGVLFRRTSTELMGGGGLWDESKEILRAFQGRPRTSPTLDWSFPSGARIELRHLQYESDVQAHSGRQYTVIGFDEIQTFTAGQFWFLLSRLRSNCGVRPYVRATCNPLPDSWIWDLVEWWISEDGYAIPERSGVIRWFVRVDDVLHWYDSREEAIEAHPDSAPLSFTFISASLGDNRILSEGDPDYRAKLMNMTRVDRMRLLDGNWKIRAGAGLVFRRDEFRLADSPPAKILATVRFWDKAASPVTAKHPNPDWTRGARVSLCEGGLLWVDDIVSARERGTRVLALQRQTAEADGVHVRIGLWQDTGGAGKTDVDVTMDYLAGFAVQVVQSFSADTTGMAEAKKARSSKPKRVFADAWAPWVEKGRVFVKRGQPWTAELLVEADGFPEARFDDIIDAISGAFQILVGGGLAWWDLIDKAANG